MCGRALGERISSARMTSNAGTVGGGDATTRAACDGTSRKVVGLGNELGEEGTLIADARSIASTVPPRTGFDVRNVGDGMSTSSPAVGAL